MRNPFARKPVLIERRDRVIYGLTEKFETSKYENSSVSFTVESEVRDGETLETATDRVVRYVEGIIKYRKRQRRIDFLKEKRADDKNVAEYLATIEGEKPRPKT
jgi:chromosome condensin MukBEF MukE localization factor